MICSKKASELGLIALSLLSDFLRDISKCSFYFGKLRVHKLTKPATGIACWSSTELFLSFGYISRTKMLPVQ